jgi:ribosomal 50S subunit-associated protein YjgA (DUF615 family)
MSERIEEIRQRVVESKDYSISEDELVERYPEDVTYLLQRVEEQQKEIEHLRWLLEGDRVL